MAKLTPTFGKARIVASLSGNLAAISFSDPSLACWDFGRNRGEIACRIIRISRRMGISGLKKVKRSPKSLLNDSISGVKPCWTSRKKVSQADKR